MSKMWNYVKEWRIMKTIENFGKAKGLWVRQSLCVGEQRIVAKNRKL